VIRRARPGEADALTDIALRSKAVWGYDEAFMAAAASELIVHEADLERMTVIVGERDGHPVAFASVDLDAVEPELVALFVAPEALGTGLGRSLLEASRAVARERGVAALVVESDPNAEAFYRSQGAAPAGERRSPSTGRMLPLLRIDTGA
jgi:GNAT superfamily N-acetyltransferase